MYSIITIYFLNIFWGVIPLLWDSSSLIRIELNASGSESSKCQPLDHQEIPNSNLKII